MKTPKLLKSWVAAVLLSVATAHAQDTNTSTAELIKQLQQRINDLEQKVNQLQSNSVPPPPAVSTNDQRIQDLDQQVKVLKRNRELDQEAAEAKAKEAPKISIGARGFSFGSADGNFNIGLNGILQMDSRNFIHDTGIVGNDTFLLRRARPILQGTVFRDFDFLFVPDFGGTGSPQIYDAYLNYRYSPELQLQAGKFKSPVGLEQLQSDRDLFFNERSLVSSLTPNRDVGIDLHGNLFDSRITYAVGIFNGVGDGRNTGNADFEDDKAFEGRVFFQPFRTSSIKPLQGFGFGLGASYEDMQKTNTTGLPATTGGGTLSGYATDGQQQFFAYTNTAFAAGQHWRLSPQAYYFYGPFSLMGEYALSAQELGGRASTNSLSVTHLDNTAWQISGGWVLTGEDATFTGVTPRHSFDPRNGGWGALQFVGRYEQLRIDPDAFPIYANPLVSAQSAAAWSVGLNWYLNRNVTFKTSFSHTSFHGGGGAGSSAPAAVTRNDEDVLFTRIQLAF